MGILVEGNLEIGLQTESNNFLLNFNIKEGFCETVHCDRWVGGLQGLVENFKSKGLEDIISLWIGTGPNQPISEDQILNVLGKEQIQKMVEKVGISQEEASGGLASLLPEIIDKLTPNGKLPDSGLLDEVKKMIKS